MAVRHDGLWYLYEGLGIGRKGHRRATYKGQLTSEKGSRLYLVVIRTGKVEVTRRDSMQFNMCTGWRHAKDGLVQVSDVSEGFLIFDSTTERGVDNSSCWCLSRPGMFLETPFSWPALLAQFS
jgi:hypothetical protein